MNMQITIKCETYSGPVVRLKNWCEGLYGEAHARKQSIHLENLFTETRNVLTKSSYKYISGISFPKIKWIIVAKCSDKNQLVSELKKHHHVRHQEQLDIRFTVEDETGKIDIGAPPEPKECTNFWDMYHTIYLQDHSLKLTRYVHLVGTVVGLCFGVPALLRGSIWGIAKSVALVYAIVVPSHPIIQGNRPSSLKGWRTAALAVPSDLLISIHTLLNPFTGAMNDALKKANIRPVEVLPN